MLNGDLGVKKRQKNLWLVNQCCMTKDWKQPAQTGATRIVMSEVQSLENESNYLCFTVHTLLLG